MNLLELIQLKKILIFLLKLLKYKIIYIVKSTKKLTEESTKESLIEELSNKLLRFEFKSKSNNFIKTKCLKYDVKKILPTLLK